MSLFIIKRSTCFGLLSPLGQTYGTGLYQLRYSFKKRRSWWWTQKSETCRALNDKYRHIIRISASNWSTYIHTAIWCTVHTTSKWSLYLYNLSQTSPCYKMTYLNSQKTCLALRIKHFTLHKTLVEVSTTYFLKKKTKVFKTRLKHMVRQNLLKYIRNLTSIRKFQRGNLHIEDIKTGSAKIVHPHDEQ